MKNLQLSLKTKWFEMTKAGIKTEDYREITPYWCSRILLVFGKHKSEIWWHLFMQNCIFGENCFFRNRIVAHIKNGGITFKPFVTNTMTLGHHKSTDIDRIIKLKHKGIEIRTGNPEWGAEPGRIYFVIKHGKII